MFRLKDELHVHLYGCLTAEDVFELGKDRYRAVPDRIAWYETEYEKAFGRRPDTKSYWESSRGFETLREDFLFVGAGPFREFQARFNLMIALLPLTPGDGTVLRRVLENQRAAGIRYGEYRSFVPPPFTDEQLAGYMRGHCKTTIQFERESGGSFVPRVAFSVSRDPALAARQYAVLKALMAQDPDVRRATVALDFCGVEEGNPPKRIAPFLQRVLKDNAEDPDFALALLYHVGESFTDMSQQSSIRWVHEAHRLGAHRLGHAMAVGMAPEALGEAPYVVKERVEERLDHLAWLLASHAWLSAKGLPVPVAEIAAEQARLACKSPNEVIELVQGEWETAMTRRLQDAVLEDLAEAGAVIECCPTSSFRIGGIPSPAQHSLPRFHEAGVKLVVSSDDPGIFSLSLRDEEELCRELFHLNGSDLEEIARTTEAARSARLSGRPEKA